ncbi:UDP-forming cellulose synthase catalytic subunit [Acidithiobacillus caldus]
MRIDFLSRSVVQSRRSPGKTSLRRYIIGAFQSFQKVAPFQLYNYVQSTSKLAVTPWITYLSITFAMIMIICLAELQIPIQDQYLVSGMLLTLMLSLYNWDLHKRSDTSTTLSRYAIIFCSAYFGWHYLYWRATQTLPYGYGLASEVAGWTLLLAEAYGFIMLMFNHLVNIHPVSHPIPNLPKDERKLPFVDVFIPTYNEDINVILPTLAATVNLDYPSSRFTVWLLDDGGTDQKCNQSDSTKAALAKTRRANLRALAVQYGAKYLTRSNNAHAKSGNINNALTKSQGDLVAIFDCDHIPTRDFLKNTVPFFLRDEKLFLVQTPHNFVSQDPIEKNLNIPKGPGENELFYDVMQPGLDFWETSYFCGSAAVLRQPILKSLGGIAGLTITEDAETTIDAMKRGYRTLYLNKAMVSGLQPETVTGMIVQRVRWGTGMLQIFLLKNPWTQKGLTFVQRLLYTNLIVYWLFAYSRLALMLAPPTYLIFGVTLCETTPNQLLAYLAPYLLSSLIVAQHYYRRVRWPFISQVYETLQSIFIAHAMVKVFLKPRSPSFKVTPKGEFLDRHFLSVASRPFYVLLVVNIVAIFSGIGLLQRPGAHIDAILFVLFWAVLDSLFLLAVLGVTHEKPQRRTAARVGLRKPIKLILSDGSLVDASTKDVSWRGARVLPEFGAEFERNMVVSVMLTPGKFLPVRLVESSVSSRDNAGALALEFVLENSEDVVCAVDWAYGASSDLVTMAHSRRRARSILGALWLFVRLATLSGPRHIGHLLTTARLPNIQWKMMATDGLVIAHKILRRWSIASWGPLPAKTTGRVNARPVVRSSTAVGAEINAGPMDGDWDISPVALEGGRA